MSIIIRPYDSKDRNSIRKICCSVANLGEPIDDYFPDHELTADILTNYYLDYEPHAIFVACENQHVVGYITGSLDNRSYGLVMIFIIFPHLFLKALIRGVFVDNRVKMMIKVALRNWKRVFDWRKQSFNSHEAHIHLGILHDYRHKGVGKELIAAFVNFAYSKKVVSVSASVNSLNIPAVKFFKKQGFHIKSSYPMQSIYKGKVEKYLALNYVKELS